MKPKVSIIIPCYNDGQYIEEAINSCFLQTYKNLEIIVVDDGSDDIATVEKLKKVKSDVVKVFFNSNAGPSAARNFAIEKASGKYILPLDADDKIHSEYIEKAVSILENDSNIGVVYCEAELFGTTTGRWELPPYSFQSMLLDNIVFVTALFSKNNWRKAGGFCEEFKDGIEDYDFWISMLSNGIAFYKIPEVLFYYRVKDFSRTTKFSNNNDNMKRTYELIFQRHKEFYLKNIDAYNRIMRNTLIDYSVALNERPIESANIRKIKEIVKKIPVLGKMARSVYKKIK